MTNNTRTLNDFTVDELKGMINDLQSGVRYNDLKVKYNIPHFAFTSQTISQCKDLIAQKTPKTSEPAPSSLNTWYDSNGELHYGMKPNVNQPWTWTPSFREAVEKGTVSDWYKASLEQAKLHGIGLSDEVF